MNSKEISTKEISKSVNMKHCSVIKLIKNNVDDFNQFGELISLTNDSKNKKGGRPEIFYNLNKYQYFLFITFLKNSKKGKQEKIKLIKKIDWS